MTTAPDDIASPYLSFHEISITAGCYGTYSQTVRQDGYTGLERSIDVMPGTALCCIGIINCMIDQHQSEEMEVSDNMNRGDYEHGNNEHGQISSSPWGVERRHAWMTESENAFDEESK